MDGISERSAMDALVAGDHGDPFSVLGMHRDGKEGVVVRAFLPDADKVVLIDAGDGSEVGPLERRHRAGFFVGRFRRDHRFAYRLRVTGPDGTRDVEDPYRFGLVLGAQDAYLLAEGTHLESYKVMGAHHRKMDGVAGTAFAVWAPNARRVSVVGSFNHWDGRVHPMRRRPECGVWELFIPGVLPGSLYKYELIGPDGHLLPLKADPYARQGERPPNKASVVAEPSIGDWRDGDWMAQREPRSRRDAPISIYEAHLGSWQRVPEEGHRQLTYAELGRRLVPYVRDMGYTHLELMPITEHPFDGSWGYQSLGLFAPTSRFGTPADFRAFVDACHEANIGLIVDWVPGHFPTDSHGLAYFDGSHLYEHADPRQGFQMDWNTLIYNFGRREVANFLISSALFWTEHFHVDGLRVDAVASMLYLDYSRKAGEWLPNMYGGNENLEAISLLRRVNEQVYGRAPGALTAAEESTAFPQVSHPTYLGGLGFGYKWNMGWMHDTLRYMSKDAIHRRYHHNDLTFGLLYGFSENFILALSHDEVVHGKGSLLSKMAGDRWQKFANLRAYYAFMYGHPGKKLLFMGGEFGQEREWNHDESLDWHLLEDPFHKGVQTLVRDLNRLYRWLRPLHQKDCEHTGFEWIAANDVDQSTLAFLRRGADPNEVVIVVCNFTPVPRHDYRVGVPYGGDYVELLNTDAVVYGGSNVGNGGRVGSQEMESHGRSHSIVVTLPPLSTLILAPAWMVSG